MRLLAASLVVLAAASSGRAGLPSGFTESVVVSGLADVRSFDWTPSGDLWIAEGQGKVWVYRNGSPPILALQIPVEHTNEHGLSSLTVDPDFATNHHVWLYYTAPTPARNRLSRFTVVGDMLVSETVMIEGPPLSNSFHTGGCLRFAQDGTVFLAMGEDNQGSLLAQDPMSCAARSSGSSATARPRRTTPTSTGCRVTRASTRSVCATPSAATSTR
jgi:glucose/arabinose dehydrogenase